MAGGMLNDAIKDKVNLAKKCKDGAQVNVPFLSAKQKKEKEQDVAYGWQHPGIKHYLKVVCRLMKVML